MNQAKRDQLLETLAAGQTTMQTAIDKIHRGLYGEEENNTTGLIAEQKADQDRFAGLDGVLLNFETRIADNEKFKKDVKKAGKNTLKALGAGTAAGGSVVTVFFDQLKQFFINIFHLN